MAKRIMTTTVRMTGVTKAVITGGGRANKARPAEATTIYAENAELGDSIIDLARQVLLTEKEPYKYESRKTLEAAVQKASRLAELLGGRGAGSVNAGACVSTSKQLVTEINNVSSQTFPPSMKTNVLYIVQLHASLIEKFSEATNTDLKINESKRLEELSKAFPLIAKEVFPHMPDLTYAQPLSDACNLVPRITFDVRELVKTAAMYTAGETYATNSSKMLFYLLNEVRRNAMAGFPPSPYDSRFPQVGPPDAQFQLSSAEFATGVAETATAPTPDMVYEADSAPQLNGINFDDMTYAPVQQEDEYGMTSSGGPLSMSMSSYGSNGSTESGEPSGSIGTDQYGMPVMRAVNPNAYGGGMNIGSAPAGTGLLPYQQATGHRSGGYPAGGSVKLTSSQGSSPISFGDPSSAPNTPVPQGKYAPPGTNRPAPGMPPTAAPPSTGPPTPGFGPGGPGSPGVSKFTPLAHMTPGFGPGGPGSPGSAKLPPRTGINGGPLPGSAPNSPSSAKLPLSNSQGLRPGPPMNAPPATAPGMPNGGPTKFAPLTLGGTPTPPSTPPPTSNTPPQPLNAFGPKGPGMVKGGFFPVPVSTSPAGSPPVPVHGPPKQPSPPPMVTGTPPPTGMLPKQPIPGTPPVGMIPKQPIQFGSPVGSPKQPVGMMHSPGGFKQPPTNPQQPSGGFLPVGGFGQQPQQPQQPQYQQPQQNQYQPPQQNQYQPPQSIPAGLPKANPPKIPMTGPPQRPGAMVTPPGPSTMSPEMLAQQQLVAQQQQLIEEQQRQLMQHQLQVQQREQEELIKRQQEELARIDEARKADESRQAEEAAQAAVAAAKAADEANKASAFDELSALEWKF